MRSGVLLKAGLIRFGATLLVGVLLGVGCAYSEKATSEPKAGNDFPPLETLIHPNANDTTNQQSEDPAEKPVEATAARSSQSEADTSPSTSFEPDSVSASNTVLQQDMLGPPVKMETVYTELPGILVLPIIPPTGNKAFHDSSVMVANSLAEDLGQKLASTMVHQPYYTLQNLHHQGFDRVYKQLNDEYFQSGSPSPTLTQYLLDKLQPNVSTPAIHRIVFVQSNVNMTQPDKSNHVLDMFNRWVNEAPSNTSRYFLDTRVKVYDSSTPHLSLIWQGRWTEPVKTERFANVSLSIYDSSDARAAFQKASNRISTVLMLRAPKNSYMQASQQPVTATRVNARHANTHP